MTPLGQITELLVMSHEMPLFLTRAEVADLLRLSERQVDRLVAQGLLTKQKTGGRRTVFHRDGVASYIAQQTSASAGASPAAYGSQCNLLVIELEEASAAAGEALDRWLASNGLPGCMVLAQGTRMEILWPWSLPYTADKLRRAIKGLRAAPRMMA